MASSSKYLLSRGLHASVRLNFQHWAIKRMIGGLIHPKIPINGLTSIADLGTGTAIWPIEVAEELKATGLEASVKGFDISSAQYPAPNLLPPNIHLDIQDAFDTFEPKYHSYFDLVQVRGFVSFTRSAAAEKLLHNVFQILKPGGYLQWIDVDPHKSHIVSSDFAQASPVLERVLQRSRRPIEGDDPVFTFLPELPNLALSQGLQCLHNDSIPTSDLDQLYLNQSLGMAFEDSVISGAKLNGGSAAVDEAEMMVNKLLSEIEAGARMHMEMFCFIAQKVES
ncbi:hypothetical protein GQ43DRAFT_480033 [Delitschia confertaspora ATCC 74209]|uniref:Methyltransferase domain-containing protein n=1 Tax=Delitschia confertaspora ATCC 74209 TaxID=1513339 RepID=A0A9P4JMZ5_9PLEO|nr:hypothetical protein GQ43DRAFT_480033 [Delitschia confertaspora ATCC 74209]